MRIMQSMERSAPAEMTNEHPASFKLIFSGRNNAEESRRSEGFKTTKY